MPPGMRLGMPLGVPLGMPLGTPLETPLGMPFKKPFQESVVEIHFRILVGIPYEFHVVGQEILRVSASIAFLNTFLKD